ncbi:MAG: hypothetical protein Kow006_11650 [Gammaproteobacteria bacterium]
MMLPLISTLLTVAAGIGIWFSARGLVRILRRKPLSGAAVSLGGALLAVVSAAGLGIAGHLHTYHRFTQEQQVAQLAFERLGESRYRARLEDASGRAWQWELLGDEWQLDARLLRWHGVATLLGFDPLYRLERIGGRYRDVARERSEARSVFALSDDAGLDLWRLAQRHRRWLPWIDATYGSATYLPMADGARYAVYLNANGLVARPLNEAGEAALRDW